MGNTAATYRRGDLDETENDQDALMFALLDDLDASSVSDAIMMRVASDIYMKSLIWNRWYGVRASRRRAKPCFFDIIGAMWWTCTAKVASITVEGIL